MIPLVGSPACAAPRSAVWAVQWSAVGRAPRSAVGRAPRAQFGAAPRSAVGGAAPSAICATQRTAPPVRLAQSARRFMIAVDFTPLWRKFHRDHEIPPAALVP